MNELRVEEQPSIVIKSKCVAEEGEKFDWGRFKVIHFTTDAFEIVLGGVDLEDDMRIRSCEPIISRGRLYGGGSSSSSSSGGGRGRKQGLTARIDVVDDFIG